MIDATRFLVESTDRENWLEARRHGVTATEVAKAATPSGFKVAVEERLNPTAIDDNPFMAFGRDNEGWLARWVKDQTGVMPNRWLIMSDAGYRFLATPDGLSLDHLEIAEIKTGGKAEYVNPPIQYRRQMQWQMLVTGATRCYYAFMLRSADFQPAWMEPKAQWIDRDPDMIANLLGVAANLLAASEETDALVH
jgi:putative phage-type endonuclease